MIATLAGAAARVLATADAAAKAGAVRDFARRWRSGEITAIGSAAAPVRPARPARPVLRPPREMPRRRKAQSAAGRIALLHALAHIELNAIDLACDIIARFCDAPEDAPLPRAFFDDWVRVADEEALHFTLLADRLNGSDAAYGDLPAHDGLWEAAAKTAHDLLARLAVVPLVLEARGLDVTPAMIANLERAGDIDSAAILKRIYHDEIGHVAIGWRWFAHLCTKRGLAPETTYHDLVRRHFGGALKPPFNEAARSLAGLTPEFYQPLASQG
jgi:uncharacterized ferritin-like protein (DUF455 family)